MNIPLVLLENWKLGPGVLVYISNATYLGWGNRKWHFESNLTNLLKPYLKKQAVWCSRMGGEVGALWLEVSLEKCTKCYKKHTKTKCGGVCP
jgi:hypothetical protein